MKIIHTADLHLGSPMDAHLPADKVKIRREELRNTFSRMIELAKREGVRHIMLAGDVFDGDRPLRRDRELFYDVVKGSPDITFYYLRGNHDTNERYDKTKLPNLVTFTDKWTSHEIGEDVVIHAIEMADGNARALYQTLNTSSAKTNIVMLHGQTSASIGSGLIHLPSLTGKHINYLALGHVHSYSTGRLDADGIYAYSGCLEGRGFDECGQHGFIMLDISDGRVAHSFIPFSERVIKSVSVDVGDCDGAYSLAAKIRGLGFGKEDMVRVELVGECDFDLSGIADSLEKSLSPYMFFIRVKNHARKRIDLSVAECELSLKGEFIRAVRELELPDADKDEIINTGLRALSGEDI